jgi:hypothetical protein
MALAATTAATGMALAATTATTAATTAATVALATASFQLADCVVAVVIEESAAIMTSETASNWRAKEIHVMQWGEPNVNERRRRDEASYYLTLAFGSVPVSVSMHEMRSAPQRLIAGVISVPYNMGGSVGGGGGGARSAGAEFADKLKQNMAANEVQLCVGWATSALSVASS